MAPPAGKDKADAKEREQQGLNEPSRYKVAGSNEVLGHAPGSVFEVYLEEEQERTLLESGALSKSTAELSEAEPVKTPAARAEELAHVPETAKEAAKLEPQPPVPPAPDAPQEG